MEDIQDAITKVCKSLAEIAKIVIKAMDNLTPEQRIVIEFLAKNPEIAEEFQELNQRLARQEATGGTTKENTQSSEHLIRDDSMQQEIIDLNNRIAKFERQIAESQSHIPETSIDKWC